MDTAGDDRETSPGPQQVVKSTITKPEPVENRQESFIQTSVRFPILPTSFFSSFIFSSSSEMMTFVGGHIVEAVVAAVVAAVVPFGVRPALRDLGTEFTCIFSLFSCSSFLTSSHRFFDNDRERARERERQMKRNEASGSDKPRERGDDKDLDEWFKTKTRTGGAYIPPSRLKAMQKDQKDQSSIEFQRTTWEALKKSINGLINKVRGPFPQKILDAWESRSRPPPPSGSPSK